MRDSPMRGAPRHETRGHRVYSRSKHRTGSLCRFVRVMAKNVEICVAVAYAAYCYYKYLHIISTSKIKKPWKKRRWWLKSINGNRTREHMDTGQTVERIVNGTWW
ncbi:unnamed protein product [Acanthoscelides obtectus]|uniref:Uncharacterized protein n=1 Tax=Acanthoscelides obtectus TaxID=200917 RepID=A0A9P0KA33_ACAOB|nr:unnamed protein product [Acanthoscelides obtectus]CAK1622731.1 hypothetical protein AOBTE_LOCUS1647 [Acanthoscelides obtectus]